MKPRRIRGIAPGSGHVHRLFTPRSVVRDQRHVIFVSTSPLDKHTACAHSCGQNLSKTVRSCSAISTAHVCRASTTARVINSVESTTARTGPTLQTTAGMRVSRSTGNRIPSAVGAGAQHGIEPKCELASEGPSTARLELRYGKVGNGRTGFRFGFETDVDRRTESVGDGGMCTGLVLVGRQHESTRVTEFA